MTDGFSCFSRHDGGASDMIRQVGDGVFMRGSPMDSTSLSPSLWTDRVEPAFELKFGLDPATANDVARWASERLNLDPHAIPAKGNTYSVHGLYFDTPALDVFHRSPGYRRKKYRLRRYGTSAAIFLEQKRKSAGKVAKRRTLIEFAELNRLREPHADPHWLGGWFHHRINLRRLEPSCCISYERQAYFGHNGDGPMRLTLDSEVRASHAERWMVNEVVEGAHVTDKVLLELKYRSYLPVLFRTLMQDFGLQPGPLSKYRFAIHALGRARVGGAPGG